jgi:hypothetical protein
VLALQTAIRLAILFGICIGFVMVASAIPNLTGLVLFIVFFYLFIRMTGEEVKGDRL